MAATQGEKGDEKVTVRSGKKTNLLDHHSIKNLLDESVGEVSIIIFGFSFDPVFVLFIQLYFILGF